MTSAQVTAELQGSNYLAKRAAGANQPSSTSKALGFPTCLFPFILQALHIPTGRPPSWLHTLFPLRVDRPPGGLASTLVLHLQEPLVQRQVVSDGVLPPCRAGGVCPLGEVGDRGDHPVVDLRQCQPPLG